MYDSKIISCIENTKHHLEMLVEIDNVCCAHNEVFKRINGLCAMSNGQIVILTSLAKEVMFAIVLVCWFVGLCISNITQNVRTGLK